MMDAISESRLAEVHPVLRAKIEQLYDMMQARGIEFRITQGFRAWTEQAALYAQGRTAPGPIVTNAPPGHSWHEYSLAVDFVPMAGGEPDWDIAHPVWTTIRDAGESIGLVSGSRWHSPDWPHFQLTGTFPVSPNEKAMTLFATEGRNGVWNASGLAV